MSTDQFSSTAPPDDVLRSLDEPLFALDGAGTTVFVNDRGADLLEADRAALTGEPLLGRLSDRLGSYVQDKLDQAIAAGEETGFETYADPLGSWIRVTAFPFRDGLTVRVREYAEQTGALAPSAVTEGVDGIAVLDDGEFVHVDRDYASAFGFDSDDLVGHDWRRLYDDATTARIETEVLPAVAQRGRWQGELVGESRDGESVEQAVTVSEVADGRVVWTGREITSRKQYGRELAQQRTRIRALFDKSPDGIVVHDADGNVLDANDTECETLGIDREELLSKNVAEFEVGYDREDLKAMWAEMDEGEVLKVEGEHRRSDGEVFPVEIWVNKVIVDGTEQYIALDRDITDRKTRERELRRTREFIEKAQETASIGGWEVDVRDDTLRWTDEVYRIHGVTPDTDVSVTDSFGFYHPDDRQEMAEAFERLQSEGESFDRELRIQTTSEQTRWIRAVGEPQFDGDDTVVGALGIFQDVTERKEREQELRETKERLDLAVEGANLGIWDWNLETDAVTFNDRWATMLGLSPNEIEPHLDSWEERVHPDDMAHVEASLTAHLEGEAELYDCEHRMRTADGDWKWIRDVGRVVERDADGTPVRAVGIHLDIDQRKQYEETLEQTREELRQIIDLVPDLIFAKEEEGVYLLANETTADAYGLTPEAVEGKTEREIIPNADESADFRKDDRQVIESGEPLEIPQEELTRADGETRLLRTTKIPYTVAGSDTNAVLGYARDITDLKSYEQRLEEQRDNLKILNQIVRHDIRNNLNIVLGYAEYLEAHVDEAGAEYLDPVLNAAREAVDITTSAREVTELLLQAETERTPTNLRHVLQHRIDDAQAGDHNALITTVGGVSNASVLADDMLGSVFRNLLQNAILHNDADVPEIRVSTTGSEDRVRVFIADNGPGIPDERKEKIFDEGERGIDSEGTGLGLYLVRTLVNRYEGNVWVEDNERGGATFVVELPRADGGTGA
ncbi:PAS domain S-box protein [Halobellus clavatus]|uniref:PAS domain S-box protein n=1 Tax=Halobellus clavatus TaxID=660517 RepID=UPI001113E679|nr:PAS domain S-box protein [Halobellus clavatus]